MATQDPLLSEDDKYTGNAHGELKQRAFSRTMTDILAFPRTLTNASFRTFSQAPLLYGEDALTTKLIRAYGDVADEGVQGDLPSNDQDGFAQNKQWWIQVCVGLICAVISAFSSVALLDAAEEVPKRWMDNGNFDEPSDCDLYSGKKYFIPLIGGAGLIIGLISIWSKFPEERLGFFKEVQHCDVKWREVPITFFLSAASLAAGTSLGPEQALAMAGGGVASMLAEYWGPELGLDDPVEKRLAILAGFISAMASLFPSPILALLIIVEFTPPPKAYMECITLFTIVAVVNYTIFYLIEDLPFSYLGTLSQNLVITENWNFKFNDMWIAVIIGVMSALIGLMTVITVGIMKQIFLRIKERLKAATGNDNIHRVVNPLIGGLVIGCLAWLAPLTIGDGCLALKPIVKFGATDQLSKHTLLCTLFAKMFAMAISMNCGFVGGFLFPLITIATLAGVLAWKIAQEYDDTQPVGLYVSCFLAAVPGSFAPMPLTLICLPALIFFLGLDQIAPIFTSVGISYLCLCGSGLFERLSSPPAKADAEENYDSETEIEQQLGDGLIKKKTKDYINGGVDNIQTSLNPRNPRN